jgi:hypothetical protein
MSLLYFHPNQNNALLTWRRESLDGKDYIVAQGVPLVEGVLNGRFVSAEEFGAFVNDWNGVPVVMRHPKQNDGSARVPQPDVPVIGKFYGAKLDGARLTGEYWLEADKLDNPEGEMILSRLSTQQPSETSTGYWAESIPSVGNWNGQDFAFVDQNIHPDHIALLPDEVGACSLADGCGLNRNARQEPTTLTHAETHAEIMKNLLSHPCIFQNVTGLTGRAAELWEEVYQSYIDKDESEERAAQAAWAAVKGAYEKSDEGEWIKKNRSNALGIPPHELEGLASLAAFVAN